MVKGLADSLKMLLQRKYLVDSTVRKGFRLSRRSVGMNRVDKNPTMLC